MPKRTGKIVEEIYSKESDEEYSDEQEQDNEYNGTTIICIRDGSIFKKIMDLLKEVLDVGIFIINDDGITLQSLDSSHVSLIQMLLEKSGFSEFIYNTKQEDDLELAIHMGTLCGILKCLTNGEEIRILHEEGSSKVGLIFENKDTGSYKKFNLNLLNDESSIVSIPDNKYDCRIKTLGSEFQNILKNLSNIGDYVSLSIDKKNQFVNFESAGLQSDALIRMIKNNYTKIKIIDEVSEKYSLKYLATYAKSCSFGSRVSIFLKKNSPIILEYKIDHIDGILKYYIAPKSGD